MVLPVPGGPNSSTPFHGCRMPVKNSGTSSGSTMASFSSRLATSHPTTSANVVPVSLTRMSRSTVATSAGSSPAYLGRSAGSGEGPPTPGCREEDVDDEDNATDGTVGAFTDTVAECRTRPAAAWGGGSGGAGAAAAEAARL